tara:strand:- start:260 stop:2152 length:1893 start_codon:yes stop_codon:yes gene_type:complete
MTSADSDPDDLDAARGFDSDELATCVRVLTLLGGGASASGGGGADDDAETGGTADDAPGPRVHPTFHHKAHKQLRMALRPLLATVAGQLGSFGVDPAGYKDAKQAKKDRNRRIMMERAADREAKDKTRMRAERLTRLAALERGHDEVLALGEAERISAIGDGDGDGDRDGDGDATRRHASVPHVPDGACSGTVDDAESARIETETPQMLNIPRQCYVCKCRYRKLHGFYASLCPQCAGVNWSKRTQTADMSGRVALVTGARVKIGYRIALKLLRCGAAVVATTRFPVDARGRFEKELDAPQWLDRLTVVAMDLRDLPGLERLCAHLASALPRLDVIVNNACQTVRRPPAYYRHLLEAEAEGAKKYLTGGEGGDGSKSNTGLLAGVGVGPSASSADGATWGGGNGVGVYKGAGWMAPSAAASQLELIETDTTSGAEQFPPGVLDVNGQQVDLRDKHSWTMRLGEVETPELLEVLAVNAAAPFVLNGKLRGLMERTAATNGPSEDVKGRAFVVNVSAMEGKFYRYKTANHPHTNMAKAALNMMTATAAADYASCGIYMNAVDTGWINDENPLGTAARIAKQHSFQTPIDEEDAAARCVAPVLEGIEQMLRLGVDAPVPPFGKFFKDYRESEW